MNKLSNGKKSKVPKLTEAEYAAYISSLKSAEESVSAGAVSPSKADREGTKSVEN